MDALRGGSPILISSCSLQCENHTTGLGERRSSRRRCPPMKWWMNERAVYQAETMAGVEGVERKKAAHHDEVEVMKLKEVHLATTPVPRYVCI